MVLIPGKLSGLILLLIVSAVIMWRIMQVQRGRPVPELRSIAGLEAIDELIGRCVEMGRKVHVSPGRGGLVDVEAPQILAGLEVMSYVARQCARLDADIVATVCQAEVYPVAQAIVQEAFQIEGKADAFREDMVRYLSPDQFAYAAGILGMYERERIGGNVYIGLFFAESLLLLEGGFQAGVMQVGGTANTLQTQFFVAAADYALLGEEIFASGAYLGRAPWMLGSLLGQDIGKMIFMGLIVVGVILKLFGSNAIVTLLSH